MTVPAVSTSRRAISARPVSAFAALLACVAGFAACSSGGGSGTGIRQGGDFIVLRTTPQNNGTLFLNEPIQFDFSSEVDLSTADLSSISFQVFDVNGNPVMDQVAGSFRIGRATGDELPGRRLEFVPLFPTNDTYDNGGFRPARRYLIQLPAGDHRQGTVLRDVRG